MKKTATFLSAVLALIMAFSAVVPTVAFAEENAFEEKEVKTYLYSMEKSTTTLCLFEKDLPIVPYIDPVDYLDQIYTIEFAQSKNEDGTYSVTCENGTMTVDAANDAIHFDNYENFVNNDDIYTEGSMLDADYCRIIENEPSAEQKALDIGFSKYAIDIVEYNDKAYLPLPLLNTLFAVTYNGAEYIDGNLYFLHTMEEEDTDGYFDRSSLYENVKRGDAMIEFTYNMLCLQMDFFYGMPAKAKIAESIKEKGFDKTLDEYSDLTREAKKLMKSEDINDFYLGLAYLSEDFDDGGHSVLMFDPLTAMNSYPDSYVSKAWMALYGVGDEKFKPVGDYIDAMMIGPVADDLLANQKSLAYSAYEEIKVWEDTAAFYVYEDTGIFSFDSFLNEVVEPFKWSLDYAAEKGLKRFVIDLSTNGGGSSAVLEYMLCAMTNKNTGTSSTKLKTLNTLTGNITEEKVLVDLNLDGEFDEKDNDVSYDFDFGVITTSKSFSCGNLFPVIAKELGIVILGETSGGGECAVFKYYLPENQFYALSGIYKFALDSGKVVDNGAEVDYDLRKPFTGMDFSEYGVDDPALIGVYDYGDLYDFELIGSLMDEFYGRTETTEPSVTETVPSETESDVSETDPLPSGSAETVETKINTTPQTGADSTEYMIYLMIALLSLYPACLLIYKKQK